MRVSTKYYLDKRRGESPYPLRLSIIINGKAAYIATNIRLHLEQWDGQVIKHPRAQMLNAQLSALKADIDCRLLEWQRTGVLAGKSASEAKAMIEASAAPETNKQITFGKHFSALAERKKGQTRTGYNYTYACLKNYTDIDSTRFEEVTPKWLERFERFELAAGKSTATISLHFRYIRAVINDAINEEITQNYPFRKFKIKKSESKNRSLTLGELRTLLTWQVEPHQEKYLSVFKLMILLRGINLKDLALLTHDNVSRGRLEYIRAKTDKPYSIKIEPEIRKLLDELRGDKYLIDILDRYSDHRVYTHKINNELKRIGITTIGKKGKKTIKPLFPKLTTYWARHTFATIAYNECNIPMDIISDMLGHSNGMAVTNVYVRRNAKIADEAARKVIDKILYDK